ncbi:helix-turn-helix domain-containing protein [Streptomyces sp. SCA2-2]|uniref:helix-turn-helix domain-containing protein n=1 Tax=Streptomyces sp. SCA2-2 TaxID=1563677 RepID=UPI0010206B57|nr:helix-turn-helix transcriptional regulator [Streptomyces sp. SCA2-2]RZE99821.1 transcriptional regulator [Streptomyces sp. SCA2-2]
MVNRKELNPEASPHAAFGAKLRVVREGLGLTQDQLGNEMGYTCGHISSVETGRKVPTLRFSRQLDQALAMANTEDSFERQWREIRHGSLLEGYPEYIRCEARASEIRLCNIGIISGLLQTREYAYALAEGDVQRGSITADQAEERISVLEERQAALVRPRPPMVLVVMDESCLHHAVGGEQVMKRQLQHLAELASRPNLVFQVSPFSMGARRPFNLPINLLTMADRSLVAYTEAQTQGILQRETTAVVPLVTAYHQLQAEALSQAASVALIQQV